jgi:SAM-dependent methyltransferase
MDKDWYGSYECYGEIALHIQRVYVNFKYKGEVEMPVCELCGGKVFSVIATEIREGAGIIIECDNCSLVIQDVEHDEEQLKHYYNEQYQLTNSLQEGTCQTALEHFNDRLKTLDRLMEKIRPLLKNNMTVLDIGCGSGELLHLIKPYVNKVVGVELCTQFVDFMNKDLGIEAYAEDINKIKFDYKFDLILSIATLDHLSNPLETLGTIRRLLKNDGVFYLEVPNRNEGLNYFLPENNKIKFNTFFWHKAHLFYFTEKTIRSMLTKAGFSTDISVRHEYSLKNYLNWYFTGKPMKGFLEATRVTDLFGGSSGFESEMNNLFAEFEPKFQKIMECTGRGDTLCCVSFPLRKD